MGSVKAWECGRCHKLCRDIWHLHIALETRVVTLGETSRQPQVYIDRCDDCVATLGKELLDALHA